MKRQPIAQWLIKIYIGVSLSRWDYNIDFFLNDCQKFYFFLMILWKIFSNLNPFSAITNNGPCLNLGSDWFGFSNIDGYGSCYSFISLSSSLGSTKNGHERLGSFGFFSYSCKNETFYLWSNLENEWYDNLKGADS